MVIVIEGNIEWFVLKNSPQLRPTVKPFKEAGTVFLRPRYINRTLDNKQI